MYRKRITQTSGKAAFRVEISNISNTILTGGPIGVQIQQTPTLNGSSNPNQYPLRGISCQNLSPAFFATAPAVTGPISNRIFGVAGCYSGTNLLTEFAYNKADNTFNSRANTVVAALGTRGTILTGGTGRMVFYMTPSGGGDIDLIIWNPCTQTPTGSDVTVDVFCSNTLREFIAYYQGTSAGGGCTDTSYPQQNLFIGNVANAIGQNIGLYDWAFSDFMASGVRADGYYWLPGGQPGLATQSKARVLNGIIVEWQSPCLS
jgi:hypothetical protein